MTELKPEIDPKIIYLQEDYYNEDGSQGDRLWCEDDIFDKPVKYIRYDAFEAMQKREEALVKRLETIERQAGRKKGTFSIEDLKADLRIILKETEAALKSIKE